MGAHPAAEGPDDARRLGRVALRLAALPHLLQDLHREGLGRARPTDPGRLGRAAHQEPVARARPAINAHPARSATRRRSPRLIEEFQYPKYGPGMMWERVHREGRGRGHEGADGDRRDARSSTRTVGRSPSPPRPTGVATTYDVHHVISSMPIGALLQGDGSAAAGRGARRGRRAALPRLHHRRARRAREVRVPRQLDLRARPDVKVGRIQNFGSWSPYLVKDGRTCLGLEFFVNEGDEMWDDVRRRPRRARQARARAASASSTPTRSRPATSCACRRRTRSTTALQGATSTSCASGSSEHAPNVYPVGRNGMHKYNNQDHSMFTAMLRSRTSSAPHHDIWSVNVEAEYHEESSHSAGTGRSAPVTG